MLKKYFRQSFYVPRAVLIAAAYLCVLILAMKLPGYLPYIITAQKYGPAKSVLLLKYWSNLSLAAWLVLGPLLVVMYHILWYWRTTKQTAAETPGAPPPSAGKRQRHACALSLILSLFLTAVFTIPFVIGVPVISGIKAAKEDLGCLSRGEYMSYRGSFNEIRLGSISAVANDAAPATIFELYSQYNYRKGASSSYYFICPIDTGRGFGFAELRRGEDPAVEIGPYEVKYLPNTHVITEMRASHSPAAIRQGHEPGPGRDYAD